LLAVNVVLTVVYVRPESDVSILSVPANTTCVFARLFDAILPATTLPVTDKLANVPTDVMLGCALVVNVPVK
jgi:hypothetical protein